jgi:hypothetical protein
MRYFPPPSWPPTNDWPPPVDDWTPPDGWEPRFRGLHISPDGDGYYLAATLPEDSRRKSSEPTPDDEEAIHLRRVTRMLGMWARDVQRATHSYYQAAMKAAWTDRAIEYMEDWSPDQYDLSIALEDVWVRGYYLIMGLYQMEQWLSVYRKLTQAPVKGDDAHNENDQVLRVLRNTIEHLSDARLTEATARRDPANTKRKKPSIDKLPGSSLFLGFSPGFHEYAFGLVNLKIVFSKASKYAQIDRSGEEIDFEPSDIDFENILYGYNDES